MRPAPPPPTGSDLTFTGLSLTRFKAFEAKLDLDLAPITVIIGANNTGKTTLVRAPWFVSQPFAPREDGPFAAEDIFGEPAPSLLRVATDGRLSGFEAELRLRRGDDAWALRYQATADLRRSDLPILAHVRLTRDGVAVFEGDDVPWSAFSEVLRAHELSGIHSQVDVLGGLRSERGGPWRLGVRSPTSVGFRGENAPYVLERTLDREPLHAWSREHLGLEFTTDTERELGLFYAFAETNRHKALLNEAGAGVVQILPVAVALLLLPRLPALFSVEHPELHLHPHAHRGAAELFISARRRHPNTRFLVETHSDTFILRLRRAVVEGRLQPHDVVIYTVDADDRGATARPIRLNDRGVPDWWPKGVFAEAQAEFLAMRSKLVERDLV